MADKKPLVLNSGALEQLQPNDNLDIPLEQRFDELEARFNSLVVWMLMNGFDLPENVINE